MKRSRAHASALLSPSPGWLVTPLKAQMAEGSLGLGAQRGPGPGRCAQQPVGGRSLWPQHWVCLKSTHLGQVTLT